MFSMMSAWTSIWANNRDAGDLRRHHAHYGVTVMVKNIEIKHFIGEIASRVVVCDCVAAIFQGRLLNSSWTSDVIWPQRSGSTSHYLNEAITWTNVDWSSVKSSGIHVGAISLDKPQPPNTEIRLKITYLKFHLNFPRGQWVGVFFATAFSTCSQSRRQWVSQSLDGHRSPKSKLLCWNWGIYNKLSVL